MPSRSIRPLLLAVLFAASVSAPPALADMPLAGYRAVHDLSPAPGGDIGAISGRIVTEFSGSECTGYTTRLRYVTQNITDEGDRQTDDTRSTTYETTDGFFEFTNENYSNDELVDRSVGMAERKDDGITVKLTEPAEKAFPLGRAVVFPTEQVSRAIEAALAGKKFLALDLYDGSEAGETVFSTATVIGKVSTAPDDLGEETAVADAGFAGMRHWPVTISYFEGPSQADMTPAYTMSVVIYENGVFRDIRL
ncbi:MAG: cell envelope integrity EipB family protein, partial [Bauldia sp.]|nr:cell envelope integrity EipB family protein [Bauldia sp.]